jgi:hypothetical protein
VRLLYHTERKFSTSSDSQASNWIQGNLRFSQRCWWRLQWYGIWRRADWKLPTFRLSLPPPGSSSQQCAFRGQPFCRTVRLVTTQKRTTLCGSTNRADVTTINTNCKELRPSWAANICFVQQNSSLLWNSKDLTAFASAGWRSLWLTLKRRSADRFI